MLFRTLSAAVYGIDADLVDIEVNLTPVLMKAIKSRQSRSSDFLTLRSASRANVFVPQFKTAVTSFLFRRPRSI